MYKYLYLVCIALIYTIVVVAQPTPYSPSDYATDQYTNVTCYWYSYPGASSYDLQWSTSSNFSTGTLSQLYISGTSYKVTGLNQNTTYYWRVRANLSSGGSTSYSYPFQFKTGVPPTAKISMVSTQICTNEQANVYSSSTGTQPINCTWTFSGGTPYTSYDTYPNVYYKYPGTFTIKLQATNAFGTSTTSTTIKVISGVNIDSADVTGNTVKCPGGFVTITAHPSGMKYLWSTGEKTQSIKVKNAGVYKVSIGNGTCSVMDSLKILYDTATLSVTVTSPAKACYKDSVKLDAGAGRLSYTWSTGQKTRVIYVKKPGRYSVITLGSDSCIYKGSATVKFYYDSIFRITTKGVSKGMSCLQKPVQLFAAQGFQKYKWSTGDTGMVLTVTKPGFYSVTAQDVQGCSAYAEINLSYTIVNCMSGIYTIGGKNPDYTTIEGALNALHASVVSGPVTFNIRSGDYHVYQTFVIDSLTRLDGNHEVTFQSEAGDAFQVSIYNDQTVISSVFIPIFDLRYTEYITLKNLTINASGQSNYPCCVAVGGSKNISFIGNIFKDATQGKYDAALLTIGGNNEIFVYKNTFLGSHKAIEVTSADGVHIEGNTFTGQEQAMIYGQFSRNIQIIGNSSTQRGTGYKTPYDVYLIQTSDVIIHENYFVNFNPTFNNYGIRLSECSFTDTTASHIVNNIISSSGIGILAEKCSGLNIYHNNIYASTYGIKMPYSRIGLVNNTIYANYSAVSNGTSEPYSFSQIKTNNYYAGLSNSVTEVKNLAGSSLNIDPKYTAIDDPFAKNTQFDNSGTVLRAVTIDFFQKPRDTIKADIGAVEIHNIHDLKTDAVFLDTAKCGFSSGEPLNFSFSNQSTIYDETVSAGGGAITFGYKIDNNSSVNLASNLSASKVLTTYETQQMSYSGKLDLAAPGKHVVKVWVKMTSDANRSNDTITLVVNSKEKPVAAFSAQFPCVGTPTTFKNETVFTGNEISYTWIFPDGSKAYTKDVVKVFNNPGTYSVKLITVSSQGCKDSVTKSVRVFAHINALISRSGNTLSGPAGAKMYQWLLNGAIIPGGFSQIYTPSANGKYQLIVTNDGGCADTSEIFDFILTGIKEASPTYNIILFPNPASGLVTLSVSGLYFQKAEISVCDVMGNIVHNSALELEDGMGNVVLDLSGAKKGFYFLKLSTKNGNVITKLVLQ
jgi:hypothetical protein